jgi:hypothetical protein
MLLFFSPHESTANYQLHADGSTRVDLEHRSFAHLGASWEAMREMVNADGGWGGLLQMFSAQTEKAQ